MPICRHLPPSPDVHATPGALRAAARARGDRGCDADDCPIACLSQVPIERQRELVEEIAAVMEESGAMESVHARPKARVPIVALKHRSTTLKCDICMCNQLALRNSRLLRAYMLLDPRARQVC